MPAPQAQPELIMFPTELAMRRYQQEQALAEGWVDASGHMTFQRLFRLCRPCARIKGRHLDEVQRLLLRRQVVDLAAGHFEGKGPLGGLSNHALAEVLDQLMKELSGLPEHASMIIDWLLSQSKQTKLWQLGMLAGLWRTRIQQEGFADPLDVNLAVLRLLRGNREKWPAPLRRCRRITFRSVRWFNPFEEACVLALHQKLKIRVESALPQAHAEAAADRLGQRIRTEIMGEPWAVWAEDLGDALAVDSPDVLQLSDASRIHFSRSAGAYGEIEDLARRICWNLQSRDIPPHRIALIVPNIGTVQDIIPHVFSRFRIPYFFRRGRPVLSSPPVKAFLSWLAFPQRPERDALIDLFRNPALRIERRETEVEKLLVMPPRLDIRKLPLFRGLERCTGFQALEILLERVVVPEDHFNAEALNAVKAVLEGIGDHSLPLHELVDLLEELLENSTIAPRDRHEQGVWILNLHDAVGLDFDVVLFAGLNEGEFPAVQHEDALFSNRERYWLRQHLEEQGRPLPFMALPESSVLFEQQSVLFLSALGMARRQLVFSCQAVDQEGNEKGAGEYFRKLWNLAGWGVQEEIPLSPYDQWRIQALETDNVFSNHWKTQQHTAPEDRQPMPGESFLPVIPLPLCRARDEALQAAVHEGAPADAQKKSVEPDPQLEHLMQVLSIEAERDAFLEADPSERAPSIFCGHIPALKERVAAWLEQKKELSPTALETLARGRYVFLLEQVFGIRDPRMADDSPDPMDRGRLIHSILHDIYTAIAGGASGIESPRLWAVKTSRGWKRRNEGGADAIPLAVFAPGLDAEYEAFAERIAEERMNRTELGHAGVWAAERRKIREQVLNFVRHDAATCADERRYPALFELTFGKESAVDLGAVCVHGIIDRVDLVFSESGELERLRVLDYKGASRKRSGQEEYVDEIIRNLDCQLPVYGFAAQRYFFGAHNTEPLNALTEAGYLFYERELPAIAKSLKKSLVPFDEEGVLDGFFQTLGKNIACLKDGDFAVDPLIESYNDWTSVCRTEAVARDDLD